MAIKTCTGTTAQPYVHVQVRLSQACTITATGADAPLVTNATGDINGAYSITLWANNDLTPNSTYYTVTEYLGVTDNSFTIQVPQTAGPFTMPSILVTAPTASPSPNHVSTLIVDGTSGVAINAAGDVAARSFTASSSSPYTNKLPGAPTIDTPAGVSTGKFWDWGGQAFNVKAANAKGDGVTADATAINAAFAAVPVGGGDVEVPPGTYICDAQIVAAIANTNIHFAGGAIFKAKNSLNTDLLMLKVSNVFVYDGILDGNKTNNTSGTGLTIDSQAVAGLTSGVALFGTAVQNCVGYGVSITSTGSGGASTTNTLLDSVSISNTNTGIFINGRLNGGVDITNVRDCVVNTTVQHGMISTGANRTIFDGNTIIGAGLNKVSGFSHGIAIDGNAGSNPNQEHRVANNRITTPYDAGIEVADSVTACYIGGNTVLGAGNGATPAATYGIYFGGGFTLSQRAEIIGNHVTSSKGAGIMVSGVDATHLTKNVEIVGNTAVANQNDGIFVQYANACPVSANTCDGNSVGNSNSFSGIDLNVVTNSPVTGNVSTDTQAVPTQSRGILERGASNYNIIVGNNCRVGNITAPYIVIAGANTIADLNLGAAADAARTGGLQVNGGIAMDGATLNAARLNMPTTWGFQVGGADAMIFTTGGTQEAKGSFIFDKDFRRSKQSPTFNATPAPDPTAGEIYAMAALTGNVSVANPTNSAIGQKLRFFWTQDGTGTRTVTYSGTNWRSTGIAAQSTAASTMTIDEAVCIDGTIWRVNRLVTGQTL